MSFAGAFALYVFAIAPPPDAVFTAAAYVETQKLTVGEPFAFVVETAAEEGWSASSGGIPAPILQVKPPASVELIGERITDYRGLTKNEFLHTPFERMMKESPTHVGCRLVSEPGPDDVIALNVLAYVGSKSGGDARFVRQRLTLPVAPGADSTVVKPIASDWGELDVLNIGDKAADFDLPRANGSRVKLADYVGKKNVIVTTYRAFW